MSALVLEASHDFRPVSTSVDGSGVDAAQMPARPNSSCPAYFLRGRRRAKDLVAALKELQNKELQNKHCKAHHYAPPPENGCNSPSGRASPTTRTHSAFAAHAAAGPFIPVPPSSPGAQRPLPPLRHRWTAPAHAGVSVEFLRCVLRHVQPQETVGQFTSHVLAPASHQHRTSFQGIPGIPHTLFGPPEFVVACSPDTEMRAVLQALEVHAQRTVAFGDSSSPRPTYWLACFAAHHHLEAAPLWGSKHPLAEQDRLNSARHAALSASRALLLLDSSAAALHMAWPLQDLFWVLQALGPQALSVEPIGYRSSRSQILPQLSSAAEGLDISSCQGGLLGSATSLYLSGSSASSTAAAGLAWQSGMLLLDSLQSFGVTPETFNHVLRSALQEAMSRFCSSDGMDSHSSLGLPSTTARPDGSPNSVLNTRSSNTSVGTSSNNSSSNYSVQIVIPPESALAWVQGRVELVRSMDERLRLEGTSEIRKALEGHLRQSPHPDPLSPLPRGSLSGHLLQTGALAYMVLFQDEDDRELKREALRVLVLLCEDPKFTGKVAAADAVPAMVDLLALGTEPEMLFQAVKGLALISGTSEMLRNAVATNERIIKKVGTLLKTSASLESRTLEQLGLLAGNFLKTWEDSSGNILEPQKDEVEVLAPAIVKALRVTLGGGLERRPSCVLSALPPSRPPSEAETEAAQVSLLGALIHATDGEPAERAPILRKMGMFNMATDLLRKRSQAVVKSAALLLGCMVLLIDDTSALEELQDCRGAEQLRKLLDDPDMGLVRKEASWALLNIMQVLEARAMKKNSSKQGSVKRAVK